MSKDARWIRVPVDLFEDKVCAGAGCEGFALWLAICMQAQAFGRNGRFRLQRATLRAWLGVDDAAIDATLDRATASGDLEALPDGSYCLRDLWLVQTDVAERVRRFRERGRGDSAAPQSASVTVTPVTHKRYSNPQDKTREDKTREDAHGASAPCSGTADAAPHRPASGPETAAPSQLGPSNDQTLPLVDASVAARAPRMPQDRREPKKGVEGHLEAKTAYIESYAKVYGCPPPWGAREGKALNEVITALGGDIEKVRKVIGRYFADRDEFVLNAGHSLGVLRGRLNPYVGAKQTPTRRGGFVPRT